MTLKQLEKLFPEAAERWRAQACSSIEYERSEEELEHRTFRAYIVNGRLFAVWNNGCYYATYRWDGSSWYETKQREPVPNYYQQACRTLGRLDVSKLYVPKEA